MTSEPESVWVYLKTQWAKPYMATVVMGVFLSLIGAFDTAVLSLGRRLLYWVPMMLIGMTTALIMCLFMRFTVRRWVPLEGRPILDAAILTLLITPVVAAAIWAYTTLFGASGWSLSRYLACLFPAFVVTTAMTGLSLLISRTPAQSHAFATERVQSVAFLERLPFKFRQAQIVALSAEDHYLRVHTAVGDTLILMRLYDAIRELEGIEGSQVHRSWWVAKDAVTDIERRDGRATLTLSNGLLVPVSRTYHKALKASGWL